MRLLVLLCAVLLLCCGTVAGYGEECSHVTVYYIERPPYLVTTPQGVKGLTGSPTEWAFKTSGIPFEWKELPTARQLKLIEANSGCDCLVNYFKTPEREAFGKYTIPIYQDQPHIALARSDNERLTSGGTVDSVLSNPNTVLGVKKDWSYGVFLDAKIAQHHPRMDETMGDNTQRLKKIHAKRGDFFFTTPEEADALIEGSGFDRKEFKYINFSDMPLGEKRYLLCSKRVSDELIEKLNAAILLFGK